MSKKVLIGILAAVIVAGAAATYFVKPELFLGSVLSIETQSCEALQVKWKSATEAGKQQIALSYKAKYEAKKCNLVLAEDVAGNVLYKLTIATQPDVQGRIVPVNQMDIPFVSYTLSAEVEDIAINQLALKVNESNVNGGLHAVTPGGFINLYLDGNLVKDAPLGEDFIARFTLDGNSLVVPRGQSVQITFKGGLNQGVFGMGVNAEPAINVGLYLTEEDAVVDFNVKTLTSGTDLKEPINSNNDTVNLPGGLVFLGDENGDEDVVYMGGGTIRIAQALLPPAAGGPGGMQGGPNGGGMMPGVVSGPAEPATPEAFVTGAACPPAEARTNKFVNRIEALILTMRNAEIPLQENAPDVPFIDVDRNAWYYPSLKTAFQVGLVSGDPAGLFNPLQLINRAEFVTLALRGFFLNGYSCCRGNIAGLPHFSDVANDVWYYSPFAALYEMGALQVEVSPVDLTSRAFAERVLEGLKNVPLEIRNQYRAAGGGGQ